MSVLQHTGALLPPGGVDTVQQPVVATLWLPHIAFRHFVGSLLVNLLKDPRMSMLAERTFVSSTILLCFSFIFHCSGVYFRVLYLLNPTDTYCLNIPPKNDGILVGLLLEVIR